MSRTKSTVREVLVAAATVGLAYGVTMLAFKYVPRLLRQRNGSKKLIVAKLYARRNDNKPLPPLDEHEEQIMNDIVFPSDIETSFADIGGLQEIKDAIFETVILPLVNPQLFQGQGAGLVTSPKGVLFYGPPGTGKTMMARAIAKDADATFINVRPSTLQNKWFGETQKLVRALFSLATKLAPSIIFIDECDLFLRSRGGTSDHEASGTMKAEFMSLWDGCTTKEAAQVLVLGATNRPFDIDEAVQRRFSRTFQFPAPDAAERRAILQAVLRNHSLAPDCDLTLLANMTKDYSGSDLRELAKHAAMVPVRQLIREQRHHTQQGVPLLSQSMKLEGTPRPVSQADFISSLRHVQPTGRTALDYQQQYRQRTTRAAAEAASNFYSNAAADAAARAYAAAAAGGPAQSNQASPDFRSPVGSSSSDDEIDTDDVPSFPPHSAAAAGGSGAAFNNNNNSANNNNPNNNNGGMNPLLLLAALMNQFNGPPSQPRSSSSAAPSSNSNPDSSRGPAGNR